MALTQWQFVRPLLFPLPGWLPESAQTALAEAVASENNFDLWPASIKAEAMASFERGVELGHVAADYAAAIVGTTTDCGGYLELRATWTPP